MRQELQAALDQARSIAANELPRLLGDLEEIRATALARLSAPSSPAEQPDELIDVAEAARRLGVSPEYLYRNHNRLPFTRHAGRKLLFSSKGIEHFICRKQPL